MLAQIIPFSNQAALMRNFPVTQILIVSGDDDGVHHLECYEGEPSRVAVQRELTRLRRQGGWARALIEQHDPNFGRIGVDVITGDKLPWPETALPGQS